MLLRLGKYLHYTFFFYYGSLLFAFLSPYNDVLFLQTLADCHHQNRKESLLKCMCVGSKGMGQIKLIALFCETILSLDPGHLCISTQRT